MTTTLNNANWPGATGSWVEKAKNPLGEEVFPLSDDAISWLTALTTSVNSAPQQAGQFINLPDENDAITPTDISGGGLTEGLYNLWIYSRVTAVDPVSSAVQVTIKSTDGGVIQTFTGTNVNGNLTTSLSQQVFPLYLDGGSSITYETAYASNTANAMRYKLLISLQLIKAVQ